MSMKERLEKELQKAAPTPETEQFAKEEISRQKAVEQAKQGVERKITVAIQQGYGLAQLMKLDMAGVDGAKIQAGRAALLSPAYQEMWDWLKENLPDTISPVINYRESGGETDFIGTRSLQGEVRPCLEVVIKREAQK